MSSRLTNSDLEEEEEDEETSEPAVSRNATGHKTTVCPQCQKTITVNKLARHLSEVHQGRRRAKHFKCSNGNCSYRANDRCKLTHHIRVRHNRD